MNVLSSLTMAIISQCIYINLIYQIITFYTLKNHIAQLKYIQFSFVNHISIKLKGKRYWPHDGTKISGLDQEAMTNLNTSVAQFRGHGRETKAQISSHQMN